MKKNKGITMIALIITIIVIILIASITISNGLNTLDSVRKKNIDDTANAIYDALLTDDTFLDFSPGYEDTLDENDFGYMNLKKMYDEKIKVYVTKVIIASGDKFITTYELRINDTKKDKEYTYNYDYTYTNEKYNYSVVFDTRNEVNMPIVLNGMIALTPSGDEVKNIYTETWYSYKKGFSYFAKMEYEGDVYVWIPRYAYKIQDFYNEKNYTDVPSTAIDIVFLRENTNYMHNGEVLPADYIVHNAFTKNGIDYPGMWIKQEPYDTYDDVYNTPIFVERDNLNIHTMTNEECGACLYLMYAFENMNDIIFDGDEYVASKYNSSGIFNENYVTIYSSGDVILGDATFETPWSRISGDSVTEDKPYVIRKFGMGMFDYTNSDGNDSAKYRGVIQISDSFGNN